MSQKVKGETRGLAPSQRRAAERLFRRKVDRTDLVPLALAREICALADQLGRKVGVLITREGELVEVFLGSRDLIYLPDLGRYRLGEGRLRRLRLIVSEARFDGEAPRMSQDIYTDLEKLRLDTVAVVGVSPKNQLAMRFAHLAPRESSTGVISEVVPDIAKHSLDFAEFIGELEDELSIETPRLRPGEVGAVLVSVSDRPLAAAQRALAELDELARTAGVTVLDRVLQRRKPDPRTLLGRGKLEEVVLQCLRIGAELLVFDTELRPSQWRVITNSTELKVIDRSMLILDIFAQRATTQAGRLQVELAQLQYNLPRLVEKDAGLSRLTGGIGGRGPGETKLEVGRRRMRDRIQELSKRIDKLGAQRELRRRRRNRKEIPLIALVGYTNVGKSSLFNALTRSEVTVENKLFATLDPAQRRLELSIPGKEQESDWVQPFPVIISDTVGFIRELPEELVAAFRATLDELTEASLLVHVVDGSDPDAELNAAAVREILVELDLSEVPQVLVINKCDLLTPEQIEDVRLDLDGLLVSAQTGEGLIELKRKLCQEMVEAYPALVDPGRGSTYTTTAN